MTSGNPTFTTDTSRKALLSQLRSLEKRLSSRIKTGVAGRPLTAGPREHYLSTRAGLVRTDGHKRLQLEEALLPKTFHIHELFDLFFGLVGAMLSR